MEAYAAVGSTQVRKKLDEMLKTWKESVPGSMDTRPVFPAEVTRPIENDLIRWRTSDLQRQQEQARNQQNMMRPGRPATTPWRDTPTPPQHMNRYQQPSVQGFPILPNGIAQVRFLILCEDRKIQDLSAPTDTLAVSCIPSSSPTTDTASLQSTLSAIAGAAISAASDLCAPSPTTFESGFVTQRHPESRIACEIRVFDECE